MADNEVLPSVCTWVFPTMGIMQYNANVSEAKMGAKPGLVVVNTIKDIAVYTSSAQILCHTQLGVFGVCGGVFVLHICL